MARIIRDEGLVAQITTANTHTFGTNNGTAAYTSLGLALTPPNVGSRVAKWWIKKSTVGTGTGDITAYLVVSGGTAATRQISDSIVIDVDATAPTYQEAGGMLSPYEVATADIGKALDLRINQGTTNTNAPTGISIGVIWRL